MKRYLIKHFQKSTFFCSFCYGTLLPSLSKNISHWNWITDQIILGALPIKSKWGFWGGHHIKIVKQAQAQHKPLGLVLSAVQSFEIEGQGLPFKPVSFEDWQKQHVHQHRVDIPDFSANVSWEDVWVAVQRIDQTLKTGQSVYIHCKAGRGRSWMILMCYLTTLGGMDFSAAEKLLKSRRNRVSPSLKQIQFVRDFIEKYKFKSSSLMR
jgi:protein-tyrosine phosphatase